MGLISDFREYRKKKKIESILREYGLLDVVKENRELKDKVSDLEKRVAELEKKSNKIVELTKDEEKEIKAKYENATTPQDFVNMFAEENVEYLPNAYGTKHTKENESV